MEQALRDYRIDADKHKLSQVFRNLISNALKFTPEGGTVSVAVSVVNQSLSSSAHFHSLYNSFKSDEDLYLQLEVIDTGHGIEKVSIQNLI